MELKKVFQVMSIEHKTHRLSSRALAHLDGLLDERSNRHFLRAIEHQRRLNDAYNAGVE